MVVKAKAEITISKIAEIVSVTRYYLSQSSTAAAPSKPTTNPPGGNWVMTEPTYTSGSTNTLYFVDLTVYSNKLPDTNVNFSYSTVSKSSSYEAAKEAWNKANNAQSTADDANTKADNIQTSLDNIEIYTFSALSIDGGKTLASYNLAGCLESGTLTDGAEATSSTNVRSSEFIKVAGGEVYTWNIKNTSGSSVTPYTSFYSLNISTGAYTYLSSQSTNEITVPAGDEVYLRFTSAEIRSEEIDTICTLSRKGAEDLLNDSSVAIYIGLYSTLNEYSSVDPDDYEWRMADSTIIANGQLLFDALNNELYDETNGDIKKLTDAVDEAQKTADDANERIDARNKYIEILPDEATIRLLADGDDINPSSEVKLTSDKISFSHNGTEGAYIGYPDAEESDRTAMAASKTYVTEMYPRVEDLSNDGNWIGSLCWVARTNGHLSLKVVK